jgi:hypothetical protein
MVTKAIGFLKRLYYAPLFICYHSKVKINKNQADVVLSNVPHDKGKVEVTSETHVAQ